MGGFSRHKKAPVNTHGADGKRRVKDGGSVFKAVATVKARTLAKVDVIDALTHATANLAADRASDQAAKGCAQEGAKEAANGASDDADGSSRAGPLHGTGNAGDRADGCSCRAAYLLGGLMSLDMERAAMRACSGGSGHGSLLTDGQKKSAREQTRLRALGGSQQGS